MSESDKTEYWKLKNDPVRYAAYLRRKVREQKASPTRRKSLGIRKARWRANDPERAQRIARAGHAVEYALETGKLVRPSSCSACGATVRIEAHHHKGYEPEYLLDVVWLCRPCHRKADPVGTIS